MVCEGTSTDVTCTQDDDNGVDWNGYTIAAIACFVLGGVLLILGIIRLAYYFTVIKRSPPSCCRRCCCCCGSEVPGSSSSQQELHTGSLHREKDKYVLRFVDSHPDGPYYKKEEPAAYGPEYYDVSPVLWY